jgi:hypothetical protein
MYLTYGLSFMGVALVFLGLATLMTCVAAITMAWLSTKLAIKIQPFGTKLSDLLLPTVVGGACSLALLKVITISMNQLAGKEVRLIDFVENHGVGLDWYVGWLREKGYEKYEQILPHDVQVRELGTGKSRKEMLEEAGLNITVAPRLSVADGIQSVRRMLPRCWFHPRTKNGINALRNYRREHDEKRVIFYEKPLHDWASHASDAFRYLAIGLDETDTSWQTALPISTKWIV